MIAVGSERVEGGGSRVFLDRLPKEEHGLGSGPPLVFAAAASRQAGNSCNQVKSRVGYCPQSDALLKYMTGREIMIMYARLWGVSEPQIQQYVNKWLNSLQLEPHADKLIRTYRMEECDAFCTRLAIMVQGKFMCLGNPQHLKSKFGNIYILKVKVKIDTPEDKLDDLKFFITMTFPGSVLKQENQRILNYYIPSKDNTWGKVFGILEEAKEQFNLEDYSISQITLEQVFLSFANLQYTEDDY
ncbi:ATP-binding cassette sub-family A member 3-like protein [Camelus ferus]|nr:ATP-binding cassette sub-family A member 3-like protein [Camelus ferus]